MWLTAAQPEVREWESGFVITNSSRLSCILLLQEDKLSSSCGTFWGPLWECVVRIAFINQAKNLGGRWQWRREAAIYLPGNSACCWSSLLSPVADSEVAWTLPLDSLIFCVPSSSFYSCLRQAIFSMLLFREMWRVCDLQTLSFWFALLSTSMMTVLNITGTSGSLMHLLFSTISMAVHPSSWSFLPDIYFLPTPWF